jgi:hypothetical protein
MNLQEFPLELRRHMARLLLVCHGGDGTTYWRYRGEWYAHHPDQHPDVSFVGLTIDEVTDKKDAWLAHRRAIQA